MLFLNDLLFIIPELHWILVITGLLLFGTTFFFKFRLVLVNLLASIFSFLIFCSIFLYLQVPSYEFALFNFQLVNELLTFSFKILFLVLFLIFNKISVNYLLEEKLFFVEYFFLLGFFCVSSFLLVAANDLTVFYLAIELQALILYTLAALKRYSIFSAEGGLKYFVLGAFSSGLLLFGVSLFYGFSGSLNFFDIKLLFLGWLDISTYLALNLAVVFIISAMLFKLSAAPFHIWAPDVYEGSPSLIVLLFSTLPKFSILIFLVRFFVYFLFEYNTVWYLSLLFSGTMSVIVGTLAALNQLTLKRLYAYSAIVNIGYILSNLAYGTLTGFISAINYFIVYVLSSIVIFCVLLLFRSAATKKKVLFLADYKSFFAYNSLFSVLFSLVFFSLSGIPPLAGFFAKFFLFKTIFMVDFSGSPVVFVLLVMSVISTFYYIRVTRFTFFNNQRNPVLFKKLDRSAVFVIVLLTFVLIFFVIFQQLVWLLAHLIFLQLYL